MYETTENLSEALYPRGFRKVAALLLFFATTTMPTVILWQNPAPQPTPSNSGFGLRSEFHPYPGPPSRHFTHQRVRARFGSASSGQPSWTWFGLLSSSFQLFLAVAGGVFSLALYYPRWGFKRFALLCGPIVGVGTMLLLSVYLFARTDVYRFEICFVAIIGALPGLLLYVLLVAWKFRRLALMLPLEFLPPKPYPAMFPQGS